jgi:hypothetical protein
MNWLSDDILANAALFQEIVAPTLAQLYVCLWGMSSSSRKRVHKVPKFEMMVAVIKLMYLNHGNSL